MRSVIYARVSTSLTHRRRPDEHEGQRPESQLVQLREYCERRRWPVHAELVERDSGAKTARPHWAQVMHLCRRRRVDAVVVVALDRIGRDLRHLVEVPGRALGAGGSAGLAARRRRRHDAERARADERGGRLCRAREGGAR